MPTKWKQISDEKGKALAIQEVDENDQPIGKPIPVETSLGYAKGGGIEEVQTPSPGVSENFNMRAFMESMFRPGVTGIAGEVARAATKNLPLIARGPIPLAAAFLANQGASQVQANLPQVFKYPTQPLTMNESLNEAALDRISGRVGEAISNSYGAVRSAGGVKNAISLKLGDMFPKPASMAKDLPDALKFAEKYDADFPTVFALGKGRLVDLAEAAISPKSRIGIINKAMGAYDKALSDLVSGQVGLYGRSAAALTQSIKQKLSTARTAIQNLEKSAWDRVDEVTQLSPYEWNYQTMEIPKGINGLPLLGPNGLPLPPQPVMKTEKIFGAIDIGDAKGPLDFSSVIKEEFDGLTGIPEDLFANNVPVLNSIKKINSLLDGITKTAPDSITGRFITPYANTKALRRELQTVIKALDGNTSQAKMYGVSNKLQKLLSQAEEKSVGDPSLGWFPGSQTAYGQAKATTIERVRKFSPETEAGMLLQDADPAKPWTLATQHEQKVLSSLKSRESAERLVDAMNGDSTDVAAAYIQQAFHKAFDPENGTLDGKAFYEFFHDGATNQSIFESSKIFNAPQRRILKIMSSYAKHGKFSTGHGIAGWQDAKVQYGMFSMGTGAVTGILTGSVPAGAGMGAAFAVGIPTSRNFIEKFILDPEGSKLLINRMHATSPTQASKLTKLMLRMLPRATQVYLLNDSGAMMPGFTTDDGKIELESK